MPFKTVEIGVDVGILCTIVWLSADDDGGSDTGISVFDFEFFGLLNFGDELFCCGDLSSVLSVARALGTALGLLRP